MKLSFKLFSINIFLVIILVFSSCEDVITVKLDSGKPLITIDAFVNSLRKPQEIRLTFGTDYFSTIENPPIKGASVLIKDLTSNETFTFTEVGNTSGAYTFQPTPSQTLGIVGRKYELQIKYQSNYYTSQCLVNRSVEVLDLDTLKDYRNSTRYALTLVAKDVPGPTSDFYWIRGYRNDTVKNTFNLAWDAAGGPGADGFPFTPPIAQGLINESGAGGNRSKPIFKGNTYRVEIHSINRQAYDFITQMQRQVQNTGLFATTPENIRSNITRVTGEQVVGWFCLSYVTVKEKKF